MKIKGSSNIASFSDVTSRGFGGHTKENRLGNYVRNCWLIVVMRINEPADGKRACRQSALHVYGSIQAILKYFTVSGSFVNCKDALCCSDFSFCMNLPLKKGRLI